MTTIINGSSPSITFSDSTTQASAGLPSTGGNITGNLNVSGTVGIGTTSPAGTLDVISSGFTKIVVSNTTNGVTGRIQTESNDFLIQTDSNHPLSFAVANGASQAGIDTSGNFKFNSGYGSSAIVYGCRAWVNFYGSGSITIYGSGNVSSVTRTNTGRYTIAFSNSLTDTNYGVEKAIVYLPVFVLVTELTFPEP